jgi:hypothetical protein
MHHDITMESGVPSLEADPDRDEDRHTTEYDQRELKRNLGMVTFTGNRR